MKECDNHPGVFFDETKEGHLVTDTCWFEGERVMASMWICDDCFDGKAHPDDDLSVWPWNEWVPVSQISETQGV